MSAHWSLGVLVGVPLIVLGVIAVSVASRLLFRLAKRDREASFDEPIIPVLAWCVAGAAALIVVVALVGYYPYKGEYHQWRPVEGVVSQVSSRIISDGNNSVNQRFVLKIGKDARLYGCDDTRCATVEPGDTVHLYCKREWQWASESGYGCRWAS